MFARVWAPKKLDIRASPYEKSWSMIYSLNISVDPPAIYISSWCFFFTNPIEKYAQVKLDHETPSPGENKKYLKAPPKYSIIWIYKWVLYLRVVCRLDFVITTVVPDPSRYVYNYIYIYIYISVCLY